MRCSAIDWYQEWPPGPSKINCCKEVGHTGPHEIWHAEWERPWHQWDDVRAKWAASPEAKNGWASGPDFISK